MIKKITNNNSGFTIIELMIAISILSIILILSTIVLMGVGDYYTKGINLTDVQNVTRNIASELSSDIQFSGTSMIQPGNNPVSYGGVKVYAYCFGDIRYSYVLGFQTGSQHSLWRDRMTSQGNCYPLNLAEQTPGCDANSACPGSVAGSGSDLLNSNMHLASFDVGPVTADDNIYEIEVAVALGSSQDLFKADTQGNLITSNGNYICKSSVGQQFCATSTLGVPPGCSQLTGIGSPIFVTRRIGTSSSASSSLANQAQGLGC